jgi:glycosyltransferase involved in cell wall biosynthesis
VRVVHIIDSGGYYGAEVMLVHLCQAQIDLGLDVEVISIGTRGNYEKPLEKKLLENSIPYQAWRMMALPDLRESFKILRYCKSSATDVIHSHGYKGNILLGMIPLHSRKLPVITTVHGYTQYRSLSKMTINHWLDRLCLKRLDAIVLVSESMHQQVPGERLKQKLYTIPNGIPAFIPESANEPIDHFDSAGFNIGAIGRLSYEKNFQLLIRTMPLILDALPNAKLAIYGEGRERAALEKLIEVLGLGASVFLPGYLDEPSRIYRHADVFINCSLTEGMPITLLEAMREGCPIIATDIPASRSLLNKLLGSARVVSFSEQEIANAVIAVATLKTDQTAAASIEAKACFAENYTAAAMAEKYVKIYQIHQKLRLNQ